VVVRHVLLEATLVGLLEQLPAANKKTVHIMMIQLEGRLHVGNRRLG
jgi:hypothetical protein